ncbi:hypothetical protein ATO7_03155 [Oceanococcus atlanticus]|uniref:Uncharacterized protein n=1 Tax=Oceanococcus atlanticus TaxID=1317117 RepID=A0A1Y1SHG5_9GAMM|nr:hypothetical protein [Oceanococcus atlanticus]ORE88840.1 hypothetical protein ATO7_03155 [Oceanococcus atlanticus]RZO82528.1 MAG: hypothetical protein EVA65_17130 [Oceanococcus sp.]
MSDEDDDFVDFDDESNASDTDVDNARLSARSSRTRRCWRDVERMREQRELERLNANDSWFDDLDRV